MKFRKKPIVIEAEQWFPGKTVEGVEQCPYQPLLHTIETLEGSMFVSEGDWIITGIEGERYSCKDSIFQKTYEAVE